MHPHPNSPFDVYVILMPRSGLPKRSILRNCFADLTCTLSFLLFPPGYHRANMLLLMACHVLFPGTSNSKQQCLLFFLMIRARRYRAFFSLAFEFVLTGAERCSFFLFVSLAPCRACCREYTAEIMFETFGVPGLYIAVQAVLALAASWSAKTVCTP